jgi:aldose sugar dehydrogenase
MEAFTDRQWKHGRTAEDIFKSIKFGYKDGGMPGFDKAFTDDEIKELSAYIVKGIDNVRRYEFQKTPIRIAGALGHGFYRVEK